MVAQNSIEADLGKLINLTGKLRMLSHRAVMFAHLAIKLASPLATMMMTMNIGANDSSSLSSP